MTKRQREFIEPGYTPKHEGADVLADPRIFTASDYVTGDAPQREPPVVDLCNVASRLWKKFGGGENPALRKELYERLEREVANNGMRAYKVIQSCVKSSESARQPDRYFCASVANRMREAGMMLDPEERKVF